MELHEENPFKVRAMQTAVANIEKLNPPLSEISTEEIASIEGIGKGTAAKINEIFTTGALGELGILIEKTPSGVVDLLGTKGIGPKKVKALWKDLNIESKEALLEACKENKVAQIKGFGEKTQQAIMQELLFSQNQKDKFLYAEIEWLANDLEEQIKNSGQDVLVSISGEIRRKLEVINSIQLIVGTASIDNIITFLDALPSLEKDPVRSGPFAWRGKDKLTGCKIEIKLYPKEKFYSQLILHSASKAHLLKEVNGISLISNAKQKEFPSEEDFFSSLGIEYIKPELREGFDEVDLAKNKTLPVTVKNEDLKGIIHNHTTYSDGVHTLEQMADYCKALGYQYLGISDHSKSGAFYNNGLYENRVKEQQNEIDELNKKLAPFKIFKGIEADILGDGELDYDPPTLATFDFIVASIHSNLKMSEAKATERIIKAIENPYTTILGHASGRLLLKREGYPLDYKKVIDACLANKVIIEINANPRRLDLDWRWTKYAIDKGVILSINPDAHSMEEYENMKYGVYMAEKAGLPKELTFNAWALEEVEKYLNEKKSGRNII